MIFNVVFNGVGLGWKWTNARYGHVLPLEMEKKRKKKKMELNKREIFNRLYNWALVLLKTRSFFLIVILFFSNINYTVIKSFMKFFVYEYKKKNI